MTNRISPSSLQETLKSIPSLAERSEPLNQWANELAHVVANPDDTNASILAGRAVMLVNQDPIDSENLLRHVAHKAGMRFEKVTAQEFHGFLAGQEPIQKNCDPLMVLAPIECFMPANEGLCQTNKAEGPLPTYPEFFEFLHSHNRIAPLVVVTYGKKYDEIALHLRAKTAFDRRFVMSKPTVLERAKDFIERIGVDQFDLSVTQKLEKLGSILNLTFPAERRVGLLQMAALRLLREQGKTISMRDIIYLAARGTGHYQSGVQQKESDLYRTAVHEAGHALIAMIDSAGDNIPDCVSILGGADFGGITVESYDYLYENRNTDTYAHWRHSARVSLAGRAAEEVIFGHEHLGVSTVESDLSDVSAHVRSGMGAYGISLDMDLGETATNLAAVYNRETQSEAAHVESLVRQYIERQYCHVRSVIRANQAVLDLIAQNLVTHQSLYQEDLAALYGQLSTQQSPVLVLSGDFSQCLASTQDIEIQAAA